MTCPGAVLERWLGTLSEYDFEVQHRAGTKHGNVDGLSRGGYAEAADQEGEVSATHIAALHSIGPQATTEAWLVVARLEVEAAQHLCAAQEEDPDLQYGPPVAGGQTPPGQTVGQGTVQSRADLRWHVRQPQHR